MKIAGQRVQPEDRRTSIVFYNHTGQVSGAERVLLLTLARLPKERFRTVLLCPADGPLHTEAAAMGAECLTIPAVSARMTKNPVRLAGYLCSMLSAMLRMRRKFASLEPDLIHANTVRSGIVATLATIGVRTPVVWHVHDILPAHPITLAIRLLVRCSNRTALVTCSKAAAESIVWSNQAQSGKVAVLHNGVDPNRFEANAAEREQMRAKLGLRAQDFAIGIVGQVASRKGHLNLLRAFAVVQQKLANAKLLVVGAPLFNKDHEYLHQVRSEAGRLGLEQDVQFLGHCADVAAVMQAFDALAVSSLVEPFGLVILEAMLLGKPVIATRSGGPEEIIQHGSTGYLVPVNDPDAMAAGLIKLATDQGLYARLAAEGPVHVRRNFSCDLYMSKLEHTYSGLTRKAKAPRVQIRRERRPLREQG